LDQDAPTYTLEHLRRKLSNRVERLMNLEAHRDGSFHRSWAVAYQAGEVLIGHPLAARAQPTPDAVRWRRDSPTTSRF